MGTTAFYIDITAGLHFAGPSFVFLQDDDPKHTSRLCKSYLSKKKSDGVLHNMIWPPQSPDLNPTEVVWDESDKRVKEKQLILKIVEKLFHVTHCLLGECQECAKLLSKQKLATLKS